MVLCGQLGVSPWLDHAYRYNEAPGGATCGGPFAGTVFSFEKMVSVFFSAFAAAESVVLQLCINSTKRSTTSLYMNIRGYTSSYSLCDRSPLTLRVNIRFVEAPPSLFSSHAP